MLELIQITNDPAFARRCDALDGIRIMVDLERLGKAERQAGRDTFISTHRLNDVGRVRQALTRSRLMVRVNPLHPGTREEVEDVLDRGADLLMLPMFTRAQEVRNFAAVVAGRAGIVPLLETADAARTLVEWVGTPGLHEVFVGLNDLHRTLAQRFMFEPLATGMLDRIAATVHAQRLRFGFGGIARLNEGMLPGIDVLAEHLRLGSGAVILSRTFHRSESAATFEDEVAGLREAERRLSARATEQIEADRVRIASNIARIAAGMAQDP
jgi:hypothetical protein